MRTVLRDLGAPIFAKTSDKLPLGELTDADAGDVNRTEETTGLE